MDKFLILENENTCGQGHNPHHTDNPVHNQLTLAGWRYSHTTRIGAMDGSKFALHTYKLGEWNIGVDCRNWKISCSKSGSGSHVGFWQGDKFTKYLKRKTREAHPKQTFEVREGDGNQGCYRQGTIQAIDAFDALALASRQGIISKPRDAKLADIDGDNESAYWASYVAPIFGDSCRWCAEAHLVND